MIIEGELGNKDNQDTGSGFGGPPTINDLFSARDRYQAA